MGVKLRKKRFTLTVPEYDPYIENDEDNQDNKLYRVIIFIPFNPTWQRIVQITIVCSICLALYGNNFSTIVDDSSKMVIYYFLEIIFLADVILCYFHRYLRRINKFGFYPPRHMSILAIDTISLLPIYEFFVLVDPPTSDKIVQLIRYKTILRTVHFIYFLIVKKNITAISQIIMVVMTQILLFILFIMVFSIIWSKLSCWPKCTVSNWTDFLYLYNIDPENKESWFVFCCNIIGSLVLQDALHDNGITNFNETLLVSVVLLVSFMVKMVICTALITKSLLQILERKFEYKYLLDNLNYIVNDWKTPEDSKKRILNFFTIIWRKRNGIIVRPPSMGLLPLSFEKEIFVDVFWESLRHSHIFEGLEMPFKRDLGLVMKCEFYLPGDYLIKAGSNKNKMFYIVSGTVQVLSTEDDDSPIISFSGGTVLGEASCFLNIKMNVDLKCATDCEIHVLSSTDLMRTLLKYRYINSNLRSFIQERIKRAMMGQEKEEFERSGVKITPISILKKHWNEIHKETKKSRKKKFVDLRFIESIDLTFESRYLDLYSLVYKYESKIKSNCIKGRCPYVIEPNSSFRIAMEILHLIAVVYQIITIPYLYGFEESMSMKWLLSNLLFDNIYITDLIIQGITAVRTNKGVITNSTSIVLYRMKSIMFLIDILASLPIDYIGMLVDPSSTRNHIYMRINRVLQCYKIINFVYKQEKTLRLNYILVILIKYFLIYAMLIYFITCIIYQNLCVGYTCPEKYWIILDDEEFVRPIAYCFMHSMSIILTLGLSSRVPFTVSEMILTFPLVFVGSFIYSFLLCEIISSIIMFNQVNYNYRDHKKLINKFMGVNAVKQDLKVAALNYYNFQWWNNRNIHISYEKGTATENLKEVLVTPRIFNVLKKASIFSSFSDDVIYNISRIGVIRLLPQDTVICDDNEPSLYLHFITRGFCKLTYKTPGDAEKGIHKILTQGDFFPMIETFHKVNCLNKISTITAVEEICLNFFETWNIIKTQKMEFRSIQVALSWHMQKYSGILKGGTKKLGSFQEKYQRHVSNIEQIFTYTLNDPVKVVVKERSFLSRLLFKNTLNPHKKFFQTWEIIRSIVAVSFCFINILFDTILKRNYIIRNIRNVFRVILIIDIYIRLHLQFYKENNILITDPLETAKNYASASMWIDIVAVIPIFELGLSNIAFLDKFSLIGQIIPQSLNYGAILLRPIRGLLYVKNTTKGFFNIFATTLVIVIISLSILLALSSNILNSLCPYNEKSKIFSCAEQRSMISSSNHFKGENSTLKLFTFCMFFVTEIFTNCYTKFGDGLLISNYFEITVLISILWLTKIFVIALIAGAAIGGNILVIKYRNRMITFLSFKDKEILDEETIEEFTDHFNYIWGRTEGAYMENILGILYEKLHLDIKEHLFLPTLKNTYFFHELPQEAYKIFIKHLKIEYFKKEAEIIRCNDIKQTLYFVAKGEVGIFIADDRIASLRRGAVFGCLSKKGPTRQTIDAIAKVHVDVLTIDSNLFHVLIKDYPSVVRRVKIEHGLGHEYVIAKGDYDADKLSVIFKIESSVYQFKKKLLPYYRKINSMVQIHSRSYKMYLYLFEVHVSSIFCLLLIFMQFFNIPLIYSHLFCTFFDCLYLAHVFLNFHLNYVDPESGVTVVEPSMIRKRYLKSPMCWIDLLSLIPLNLFFHLAGSADYIIRLSRLSRILRYFHLFNYYYQARKKLTQSTSLQLFFVFYSISFQITVSAVIWYMVACANGVCRYKVGPGKTRVFIPTKDKKHAVALSFLFTVNIFTFAGMQSVQLETIPQIVVYMVNAILSVISVASICGAFTSLIVIIGLTMKKYTSNSEQLITYLQDRDISPIYIKKVSDYMLGLWTKRRGELIPRLIQLAPPYLKQNVMNGMYGHYLRNHYLFKETHIDFLRQLCVHLRSYLFLTGQNIVEEGDIDYCMYFLHKGEVVIHSENQDDRFFLEGSSFGEQQGLFEVPHEYTYTAHTPVDILILNKKEWEYLLPWFPASREKIYGFYEDDG